METKIREFANEMCSVWCRADALEGRAAAVCAAVVIINVDFVDFPALGMGIFRQQGALVLYAVAVVFGGALALVLLR